MTSTTERSRATITSIMEALSRGETRPFGEAMADDFTWRMTGTTAWSGNYVGKADVQGRMLKTLRQQWASQYTSTPSRILADGDYVVVETRGNVVTRTGKPYNNTYLWHMTFKDGQVIDVKAFLDTFVLNDLMVRVKPTR